MQVLPSRKYPSLQAVHVPTSEGHVEHWDTVQPFDFVDGNRIVNKQSNKSEFLGTPLVIAKKFILSSFSTDT